MINRIKNKIKHHFEEVLKIKTSPESIAMGFAIGTLIALLPTFGLGIFIGLLIIFIFEKVSKISLLVALAIWNPFTLIPMYSLSYQIGNFLLGDIPIYVFKIEILNQIFIYSRRFLVGNLILSTSISTLSYFIVKSVIVKYRKGELLPSPPV